MFVFFSILVVHFVNRFPILQPFITADIIQENAFVLLFQSERTALRVSTFLGKVLAIIQLNGEGGGDTIDGTRVRFNCIAV